MQHSNSRLTALLILQEVFQNHKNIEQAYEQHLHKEMQDNAWIKALCFGILRTRSILDVIIAELSHKRKSKQNLLVQLILYIGLYQLLFMDTKPHAALFETVELSKKTGLQHASGFINALLQKTVRDGKNILASIPKEATYNHPAWLLTKLKTAYPQEWQHIITENNRQPPLFLRINALKISKEAYLERLKREANISYQLPELSKAAIELLEPVDVKTLPGFAEGLISVQDIAAQQSAYLLNLQPGQTVLDACAAPGGKTCHILETADVKIIANDADASRMEKVSQNLSRLGLQAELSVCDALKLQFAENSFDRILLDAPCSATGVIRRHPDILLLRREADILKLAQTQQQLLSHLWPTLKAGGILLYATCSILPEENDTVIRNFLNQTPTAKALPIQFQSGQPTLYGWQFLPQQHGPDGFYYAKLTKL